MSGQSEQEITNIIKQNIDDIDSMNLSSLDKVKRVLELAFSIDDVPYVIEYVNKMTDNKVDCNDDIYQIANLNEQIKLFADDLKPESQNSHDAIVANLMARMEGVFNMIEDGTNLMGNIPDFNASLNGGEQPAAQDFADGVQVYAPAATPQDGSDNPSLESFASSLTEQKDALGEEGEALEFSNGGGETPAPDASEVAGEEKEEAAASFSDEAWVPTGTGDVTSLQPEEATDGQLTGETGEPETPPTDEVASEEGETPQDEEETELDRAVEATADVYDRLRTLKAVFDEKTKNLGDLEKESQALQERIETAKIEQGHARDDYNDLLSTLTTLH